MQLMDEKRNTSAIASQPRPRTPVHPGSAVLRRAIRRNIVSFPSQIPVFLKHPPADMQWRVVLLFFVRGWRAADIATRFNVGKHRIWGILNDWSVRALALGYVQVVDLEAFATCCRVDVEYGTNRETEEMGLGEVRPVPGSVPQPFPDAAAAVVAQVLLTPGGTRPGGGPVDSPGKSADLIAALDAAIAHCEEWRDEFRVPAATLLRDLRTAAAIALELRRASEQTDGRFTEFQSGEGEVECGPAIGEEERVAHAAA